VTFGAVIHRSGFHAAYLLLSLRIDFGGCRGLQSSKSNNLTFMGIGLDLSML
jgi:hypothetical protein